MLLLVLNITKMQIQCVDRYQDLFYRQAQRKDHKNKGDAENEFTGTLQFNIHQEHAQNAKQKTGYSKDLHIPDQQKPPS